MARFRKKPVEIDAWPIKDLFTEACMAKPNYPLPVAAAIGTGKIRIIRPRLLIETLEGTMEGGERDWLVMGVKGEFYPCKPDIFDITYDSV